MSFSKRFFTCLLAAILFIGSLSFAVSAEDEIILPEITAKNAIAMHIDSGTVLFEKNADERTSIAFLAKVMTVLIALEEVENLEELATVSMRSYGNDRLLPGEEMRVLDLLYCIMLATSNDACTVVAEHISGSSEEFLVLMNERAKELGATDTLFTTVHGIPDDNEDYTLDIYQHTTARDALKIVSHAITLERFYDISAGATSDQPTISFEKISDAAYHQIPKTNKQAKRPLYTGNRFLISSDEFYNTAVSGIKTSRTDFGASICSVKEGRITGLGKERILCITMLSQLDRNRNHPAVCKDTNAIWDYCFENYVYAELIGEGRITKTVNVELGESADKVNLVSSSSVSGFILGEYNRDKLEFRGEAPEFINAPVSKGEVVCAYEIIYDGKSYGTVSCVAASSITRDELAFALSQITDFFDSVYVKIFSVLIILAIIFYVGYAVFYNKKRKRARARKVRNRFKF